MNKKYLMFGILGVFSVMLVTAGLVSYLSNDITKTVDIQSPLLLTSDSLDLKEHNLSIIDFTLENLADIPIPAIVELSVSGDDFNETHFGAEFDTFLIGMQLDANVCTAAGGIDWNDDSEGYCYWDVSTDKAYTGIVNGVYYVQMGDRETPQPIEAEETLNGRLKLRFAPNLEGEYTLKVQALVPERSYDLTTA